MAKMVKRHANATQTEEGLPEATLREFLQHLASATEPQELTQKAVAGARKATAAAGAYIERVISRDEGVEVIAVAGEGTPRLGARSKFLDVLPDKTIDGTRLVIPLRAGREPLGSLGLLRPKGSAPFQESDVDRASTVADAIAIAMQRVATFERERQARGQLTRTLESIADGFISVDRHFRVRFLNRVAREALNVDPHSGPTELAGRPLSDFVPESVFEKFVREARRAFDDQTSLHFEQHTGPPDRWFDVSLHASRDQLSIFFRESTDRRVADAALRRSERRQTILADTGQLLEATLGFQSTLDRLAHLVVRWLCDWCVVYIPVPGGLRRAMLAARDPDTEMLVRRSIGEVHPEAAELETMRVLRTSRPVLLTGVGQSMIDAAAEPSPEYAHLLREHRPHSAIIVPLVARGHTIAAMSLVSTNAERPLTEDDLSLAEEIARRAALALDSAKLYEDATRRALAESALRKAAAAVTAQVSVDQVIQEVARNALVALDAAGAFVERVDEEARTAVVVATAGDRIPPKGASTPYDGSVASHVIEHGRSERISDLGTPGRLVPRVLTTRCRGCPALVVPLLRQQARGALFFIRAPGGSDFGDDEMERGAIFGELAGLAFRKAYLLELAERRQADAEAATRARDDVLAIVSHDLRNPLHTISMAASLLDDEQMALDPEKRRAQYTIIKRSSARMMRLIDDLLDVSRIEAGRFSVDRQCQNPITMTEEAFDTLRPSAETRQLNLRKEIHDGTRPVYADRDRIMQVLANFLDNAFKFSAEGSEVVLRVEPDPDGAGVRFSVQDHGPGIAAESLPHVFDRFWQGGSTAHKGAGLGLTIAKGIAEAHEGRVWVESVVGQGTTFYLGLPYSERCT
jgi:signal transduction histidine kinase/PAS domain-containing protein